METVYLVAGGTGGHINAALSVGEEFKNDFKVRYISGLRHLDKKLFAGEQVEHIQSQPLRTKNPIKLVINLFKNFYSFIKIIFLFLFDRPLAVIGAGGYVCGPTLMAAKILFIPIFIIEQNAVMGLTNKLLSKVSNLIFLNFNKTKGVAPSSKIKVVGNPIRKQIEFSPLKLEGSLNLLVFGGSLGASQINQVVFRLLEMDFPFPIKILHQVGKDALTKHQGEGNVEYQQLEYIDDMQSAYRNSHIVLSRSGASTVSELRVVKRPTIIIPFPHATDNHQYFNALNLKEESLFPVEILDFKKDHELLSKEVFDTIKKLQQTISSELENKQVAPENLPQQSSAEIIKKEVLSYVRR